MVSWDGVVLLEGVSTHFELGTGLEKERDVHPWGLGHGFRQGKGTWNRWTVSVGGDHCSRDLRDHHGWEVVVCCGEMLLD